MITDHPNTLLCVPFTTPSVEQTLALLHAPGRVFDVAELRLDYMEQPDVARLLRNKPCPVIVTNRPPREGGRWTGTEERRLELLAEADRLGADYIDIEWDARERFSHPGRARLIVSHHNFKETPANIAEIARRIEAADADIVKVATMANTPADNVAMLHVLRAARKPTIALTMGEHGNLLRILGPKENAFLVYASVDAGRESAPGQVPVNELVEVFRFREIRPSTRCFGILGDLAPHPLCAALLNGAFRHLAVDAVALPMRSEMPADTLKAYREVPIDGYAVLPPHRATIIDLLDEFEPLARQTGRVDAVVSDANKLRGYCLSPLSGESNAVDQPSADKATLVEYLAAVFELWTSQPAPREFMHAITGA